MKGEGLSLGNAIDLKMIDVVIFQRTLKDLKGFDLLVAFGEALKLSLCECTESIGIDHSADMS